MWLLCAMAFIEPRDHNKPNITCLLQMLLMSVPIGLIERNNNSSVFHIMMPIMTKTTDAYMRHQVSICKNKWNRQTNKKSKNKTQKTLGRLSLTWHNLCQVYGEWRNSCDNHRNTCKVMVKSMYAWTKTIETDRYTFHMYFLLKRRNKSIHCSTLCERRVSRSPISPPW